VGGVGSVVRTVCISLDDLAVLSQARLFALQPLSSIHWLAVSEAKLWRFKDKAMHFSRYTTQYRIWQKLFEAFHFY
jgi:hypothetical protein